ncbi:ogr/Delta-like zinc finger family protein [uncultured Enterobacter sp.]|uniref:ogr/Delta-like zinc finger family protein n=1 Tax=uncultured Enterobacter sp. TaxID=238202 RepID=UPI002593E1B1|nr:ogr/Delta-like zinc finger family protein [uncultured Enterobacter sp.]HCM9456367.1 ogr/Delta-like zinc finger family protein [Enterobacter bugandensis]HCM9458311.1 ogr/Delta-like zinc finger family protein [Enterobacter bugandensis]HDR2739112.1 ogr/Delta-like zinc finger family protein [Enterobacter bugandensis]
MFHCPFCKKTAHVRTSRYLSENVKQRYHQCANIECSATFRTIESVDGVIRAAPEKTDPASVTSPPPRKVQGCYSSPFRH